ncbi:MAG: hypothetical protein DI535_28405 [Citrobacter freundii]|nr:MAG: hypothetical protein DI535_28405 [Citrobacter freundii]
MKKLFHQPVDLFLLTALAFLLISFIPTGRLVDIHLHDTMYVIAISHLFWLLVIVLIVIWTICRLLDKFLPNKFLIWFQVCATIAPFIFLAINSLLDDPASNIDEHNWKMDEERIRWTYLSIGAMIILFLLGQLSFLINLILGIIRPQKTAET